MKSKTSISGQSPPCTQLLSEMTDLCPYDKEANCFFCVLQRLPTLLRVLLEANDLVDTCSCDCLTICGLSSLYREKAQKG